MGNETSGEGDEDWEAASRGVEAGVRVESEGLSLTSYFATMWSKDEHGIKAIKSNPELLNKYGKFLELSDEEWSQVPEDKLKILWNAWSKDSI